MNKIICTVCCCQLNGVEPLHQHLASAGHIRRVEIKKAVLRSHGSQPSDIVNNQNCTSPENLFQHETNPTHLSTENKATVDLNPLGLGDGIQILPFHKAAGPGFARPAEVSGLTRDVNISQEINLPAAVSGLTQDVNISQINLPAAEMEAFSWKPRKGPNGEAYVMTGDRGFCYVCNLELTSPQHCRQHVEGNKHIKKDKDVTSLLNSQTENSQLLNSMQATLQPEQNVRVVNNGGLNRNVYDFLGPGGHCFVCNVIFTSTQLANEHIAGQKHKKKMTSLSLLEITDHKSSGVISSGQSAGIIPNPDLSGAVSSSMINSSQTVGEGSSAADCVPSILSNAEQPSQVGLRQMSHIPGDVHSAPTAGHASAGVKMEEYTMSDIISPGNTTGATPSMDRPGQTTAHISTNALNPPGLAYITSTNVGSMLLSGNIQPHMVSSGNNQPHMVSSGSIQPHMVSSGSIQPHMVSSGSIQPHMVSSGSIHPHMATSGSILPHITTSGNISPHIVSSSNNSPYIASSGNISPYIASSGNISPYIAVSGNISPYIASSANISPYIASSGQITNYASSSEVSLAPPSRGPNGEPYIMKGGRGYCYVCKLLLTSEAHAKSHVTGKKHKKKNWEEMVNGNPVTTSADGILPSDNSRVLMCRICNVPFSSPENARQHLMSDKHRKKLSYAPSYPAVENLQETDFKPSGALNVYQPSVYTSAPGGLKSQGFIGDLAFPFENNVEHIDQLLAPNGEFWKGLDTKAYKMNGSRGTCFVCNIELTSPQHCKQHIEGKEHLKKEKEREFLSAKLREIFDPEQTPVMKVYESAIPSTSAQGNSHSHSTDAANTFENAEQQVRSQQLLPPNRELQTGANTENYVMWGDRGICYACNVELTSPQLCRQHIRGKNHIKKVNELSSQRSRETIDLKPAEAETLAQPQVQNETAHSNPELSFLSRVKKELGPFENSMLDSTGTFPRYSTHSLPSMEISNITEEEYSNAETPLGTRKNMPESNQTQVVESINCETSWSPLMSLNTDSHLGTPNDMPESNSLNTENHLGTRNDIPENNQTPVESSTSNTPWSPLLSPNTVLSESNTSAAVLNVTDSGIVIKTDTLEPNSSTNSSTQTKDKLQSGNLSSQQEEPVKVVDKEIVHSHDYDEQDNAGASITDNNLQPSDVNVTKNNLSANIQVENSQQVADVPASGDRKYRTDFMAQWEEMKRTSHQNFDPSSSSHLQSAPDTRLLAGVTSNFQGLSLSNDSRTHFRSNISADPLTQPQPDEIQQTSQQHSDPHSSSSDLQQTTVYTSQQHFDPRSSSSDIQQTPNRTSQQHSDPRSSSSDIQQTPFNTSQQHFDPRSSSSDLQQTPVNTTQQHPDTHFSSSDIHQTTVYTSYQHSDPRSSTSDLQQTPNKTSQQYSEPHSRSSNLQQTPFNTSQQHSDLRSRSSDLQQTPVNTSQQHSDLHSSSSDLQQTPVNTSQQHSDLRSRSSDLQQTPVNTSQQHSDLRSSNQQQTTVNTSQQQHSDLRSSASDLQETPNKMMFNITPSLSQQSPPPNGSLTNPIVNKSAPYHFNGSSGYCYCCSVELTSLQHANQHLHGQKHKKRSDQWQLMSALQNQNGPSQQTPPPPDRQVHQPSEDTSYYFNGDRGFCHVCNIELTSLQHAQQHLHGKPHKRTKERLHKSQNGTAYPLNCQTCSKLFTGQESAHQHFTSAKHKSRAEVLNESVAVLSVVDEGRVIMKDGLVWHVCDICKVAMNTREQFLFHKESPKHKKECENSKSRISFSEDGPVELTNNVIVQDPSNYIFRTSSHASSSRASSVETVQDELDAAAFRSMQAKFEEHQIQDEANRQRVLDENRQYLIYGQAPFISQDLSKVAGSGQPPVSQFNPVVSGSEQLPVSRFNPVVSRSEQLPVSQFNPVVSGSGQLPVSRYSPAVSSSGQLLLSQDIWKTTRSDDSREQARLSSAQATSGSSQMYEDMWQSLRADSGQNAGLDFTMSPQARCAASFSHYSGGNAKSCNGARVSEPHSRSNNQDGTGFSMEDNNIEDDLLNTGQNHLNSTTEDGSFSNADNLGNVIMKPPSSKTRSRGNGRNSVLHWDKKEIDDELDDGYEEERDDLNIIEEVPPEVAVPMTPPAPPMRSNKPGFRYYCGICDKHMNTRETYETHIKGKYHIYMLSSHPAPVRKLEPICKINRNEEDIVSRMCSIINKELNIHPRVYQMELVLKAMKGDCIIYLPTGTGKTLVAVLTMGLMLQDNPSRPVLFLVDKVLLVMQQAQYIIRHFAGTLFKRQDGDFGSPLVTRELQVKPICGGLTTKTDLPIWKHDIVVTTAAYCANMLDRGQIRWEDFSLVVLDEVHHCGKGHPYHRLMSTYHCNLPEHARAKVLGLTASPAGKSTVDQTYSMLKSLLKNLGGASVAIVEENKPCLDQFQSMAKVKPICVPLSSKEEVFKGHLLEYFILCYSQLALMTNNLQSNEPPCSFFLDALRKPGDREVAAQLAEQFIKDPEPLSEVLHCIYKARCIDEADVTGRNRFDNLRLHICQLLLIIPEVGSGADIEELLKHLSPSGITEEFKKMGLPCDQIYQRVTRFASDGNNDLTMFSKLAETLQDPDVINWSDTSSRALVLVRERKRARQYCLKLRAHPMVEKKNLRVGHIVGHGKGAKDGGMDVKKQRRVFDNHEKYHILVATSIMEEGIDIQALQLVVCMNPPNSLRALVQMRGRARREGSHFVVLCSTTEDVDKLNSLQKQEQNMQEAAKMCLKESK